MSKQDVSNLLVFGSGRLGSAIKLKFPEVTLISKEQCDITRREDVDNIIREYTPEVIINTSAITDLTLCESNSRLAWDVNVYGARNISFVSSKYKIYSVQISSNIFITWLEVCRTLIQRVILYAKTTQSFI